MYLEECERDYVQENQRVKKTWDRKTHESSLISKKRGMRGERCEYSHHKVGRHDEHEEKMMDGWMIERDRCRGAGNERRKIERRGEMRTGNQGNKLTNAE